MFCKKCGSFLSDDSEFCYLCGTKIVIPKKADQNMANSEPVNNTVNQIKPDVPSDQKNFITNNNPLPANQTFNNYPPVENSPNFNTYPDVSETKNIQADNNNVPNVSYVSSYQTPPAYQPQPREPCSAPTDAQKPNGTVPQTNRSENNNSETKKEQQTNIKKADEKNEPPEGYQYVLKKVYLNSGIYGLGKVKGVYLLYLVSLALSMILSFTPHFTASDNLGLGLGRSTGMLFDLGFLIAIDVIAYLVSIILSVLPFFSIYINARWRPGILIASKITMIGFLAWFFPAFGLLSTQGNNSIASFHIDVWGWLYMVVTIVSISLAFFVGVKIKEDL